MTPPTERCPTCDRDGCPRLRYWHTPMNQHPDDITGCLACSAMRDCEAHRVDWRARAIAAEARIATVVASIEHDVAIKRSHDHGRATGGQTCGTGGPLTPAPQSVLRYLDRVVRDLHDDRTRASADHAAQWAKVAPLIERLREAMEAAKASYVPGVPGDVRPFIDAAFAILDATEATP